MSKHKNDLDIKWLGIDGLLVAGYFIVVATILYAIIFKNDFIIGTLIPYGIMIAVTAIFINYLSVVMRFAKGSPKDNEK